jgi:hypothetical protein
MITNGTDNPTTEASVMDEKTATYLHKGEPK